eukprot:8995576-Alexandrium_andersonii.AAC.1
MDRVAVRLQELADSGRLCLTAQVAGSGAGCRRVGPSRTRTDIQRCAHEGAVETLECSGDSRGQRVAVGCAPQRRLARG